MTTLALRPSMGTRDLIVLYLTSLIGAGILVIPGITAQLAGPASLLAWGVLAAGSFAMAHMFAAMATLRPGTGSLCTLIGTALGRRFGDTALLTLIAVYVIGNPIMGVTSGRYLVHLLGVGDGWVLPFGAGFMLLSVAFNLLGVKAGARIQRIAFYALLGCLAAAIVYAVPSMSIERLQPVAPHGWSALGGAAVVAFFAFLGWENVLMVAGDVRKPRKAFRTAIAVAVPVVGLVYLVTTAAYLTVPSTNERIVLPALLGEDFGRVSMVLADLLALAVLIVATNAWVFGASRVLASASRRSLLPKSLANTKEGTGSSGRGLLVLAAGYTVVVAAMAAFGLDETPMLLFTSATFLVLYVPVAVAALRDRPSRALRVSSIATLVLVACFLPSTAAALPAVAVLVVLMWLVAVRRSAAVDEAVPHQAIGGKR